MQRLLLLCALLAGTGCAPIGVQTKQEPSLDDDRRALCLDAFSFVVAQHESGDRIAEPTYLTADAACSDVLDDVAVRMVDGYHLAEPWHSPEPARGFPHP